MTLSDYCLIVTIIAGIASTILSIVALNISHKTFQRQKTFENENHYHEYKFNSYVEILKIFGEYLFEAQSLFFNTMDKLNNKKITRAEGDKLAREIDESAYKLQKNLETLKNFIPQSVIEKIDNVLDVIFNGGIGEAGGDNEIEQSKKHFKVLADAIGEVEVVMIKDLGLDNIHRRLYNRTREFRNIK